MLGELLEIGGSVVFSLLFLLAYLSTFTSEGV